MNAERLLKLADHLEGNYLGHAEFDFSVFSHDGGPECGSSGCALGECPTVWPDDWRLYGRYSWDSRRKLPLLVTSASHQFDSVDKQPLIDAGIWFEISPREVECLFIPCSSMANPPMDIDELHVIPVPWNAEILDDDATAKQVAKSIRNFVAWKQARIITEENI